MSIPSRVKRGPFILRASSALPAAGAYDATTLLMSTALVTRITLFISYTRGAAGGGAQFQMLGANDLVSSPTLYPISIENGGSLAVASGVGTTQILQAVKQMPVAPSAGAYLISYTFDVSGYAQVQVQFAEYGQTATPGTLSCLAVTICDPQF